MKVRVKKGQSGFIYGKLRKEGDEFTLKPVEKTGEKGTVTIDSQFSNNWMEKVEQKKKPGPKPKTEKEESKD